MCPFPYQPKRLADMVIHRIHRNLEFGGYLPIFHTVAFIQQEYFTTAFWQGINGCPHLRFPN